MATIVDGRSIAARVRADVAAAVAGLHGSVGLATILVGDDPASGSYVASKRRACAEVGIESFHHQLSGDTSLDRLLALIDGLNADERVVGILCQLPLPAHLDEATVIERIDPGKDVDGLTAVNAGRLASGRDGLRPCTPSGVMELLAHTGVELRGAHAVVVGRSNLFGKPMAQLLLAADATVTQCHRHTRDLPELCRAADVLVVATGRPRMIEGDWVKPGSVVIDVGITRTPDGLSGDVDFAAASATAGWITPVPGGVGPMTIACLLQNTVRAAAAGRRMNP